MTRYEAIIVDLDGTILQADGSVRADDVAAVARARDAGIEVIIATGRTFTEARSACAAVGHDGLVIGASGALVSDAATGHTIERRTLSSRVVDVVVDHVIDAGHKVLLLKDRDVADCDYAAVGAAPLHPVAQWWFQDHGLAVDEHDEHADDPHPDATLRCGAMGDAETMATLSGQLRETLGASAHVLNWEAVTAVHDREPAPHLLEVFGAGCNKWTAVQAICERRGIDPCRVAAIGDGANDVEMVRHAGLGVAMGNANAAVLAVAKRVTSNLRDGGVAVAIEQIVAGRW
jgi:hydroxymethylpyrimidine pyrophosphatase-like HAD family hydrolase